jgi:hypothetical protein
MADVGSGELTVSTRSSIWWGESDGKCVHIYWELADRDIEAGRKIGKMVAPVYLAVDDGVADDEVAVRLPREVAEALLRMLYPNWQESYDII